MTRVVYNACYGGYGLSDAAIAYLDKRGVTPGEAFGLKRHDPMVETLGSRANGLCAKLEIESISEDRYRIIEYDGSETVETPASIEIEWTLVKP